MWLIDEENRRNAKQVAVPPAEVMVAAFVKDFRVIKKEVLALTGDVIESTKARHLLNG